MFALLSWVSIYLYSSIPLLRGVFSLVFIYDHLIVCDALWIIIIYQCSENNVLFLVSVISSSNILFSRVQEVRLYYQLLLL